ncbi:MAG TPA: family 16 glycoside hydrolase [Verrucomicrobiae bacterium]|nr:family 16 glycoside hydrolase [Verrucomicrobiae bacterium]
MAVLSAVAALSAGGAELKLDFREAALGQAPAGFSGGAAGDWKILEETVPSMLAPLSSNAQLVAKQPALAVASEGAPAERYTVLLYTNDTFQDFTFSARVKIVGGAGEASAGIVFRAQDASNYYVLRVGAMGYILWHRVVNGKSLEAVGIGARLPIAKQEWMDLKVEGKGTRLRCFLNGKLALPPAKAGAPTEDLAINDSTFFAGKIGFWAKGDTAAHFADVRILYTPHTPFMQTVTDAIVKKYPRLLKLEVYAERQAGTPLIIGSKDTNRLGQAGGKVEDDVIHHGTVYYAKDKGWVEVTLPLRDRNGDISAALKTRLERFVGETQDTAVARATAVKKAMEERFDTMQDVTE